MLYVQLECIRLCMNLIPMPLDCMKAKKFEIKDVPIPQVGPDDVLLKGEIRTEL